MNSTLLPLLPNARTCTCPGDAHPISFSVHLARLASGHSACRTCQHNTETGPSSLKYSYSHGARAAGQSLVTAEGVYGLYLNELDRSRATDWGAAFASILWDQRPRIGRSAASRELVEASPSAPIAPRRGPVVVIGFDERPSSPDMITGVALGLRRMGCQVIDLGQTTRPCFHFAIHHLDAAGGVYVTGNGFDPAWTGFHFAGAGSIPLCQSDRLTELEFRANSKVPRPTRAAGSQRPFHAAVPYQAGLWKLFHAIRPLKIACGTSSRQLPRVLDALFTRLPCKLIYEALPTRRRNLGDPNDPDIRRVAATVAGGHHLGIVIDEDGERCAFVTDEGELIAIGTLIQLLVLLELHDNREASILVDPTLHSGIVKRLTNAGPNCQVSAVAAADIPAQLKPLQAGLGATSDYRIWFAGDYPTCDAVQTLARVMQALSLSDAPLSHVVRQLQSS